MVKLNVYRRIGSYSGGLEFSESIIEDYDNDKEDWEYLGEFEFEDEFANKVGDESYIE